MAKTPIKETQTEGRGQIQVWIDADSRQLERALRQLTEGWPVQVAVDWTHADHESKPKRARPEPEPYAQRLPVVERGGSRIRYLKVLEIDWIEAERQYVRLHVRDKTFLARGPSMTIKNLAADAYIDVNRSGTEIRDLVVTGDRLKVLGDISVKHKRRDALMYVHYRIFGTGIKVEDGELDLKFLRPMKWFEKQRALARDGKPEPVFDGAAAADSDASANLR